MPYGQKVIENRENTTFINMKHYNSIYFTYYYLIML
jgi:hypothetical protein